MARNLSQTVKRGDPIRADSWNELVRVSLAGAASPEEVSRRAGGPRGAVGDYRPIRAINRSGVLLNPGDVVHVSGASSAQNFSAVTLDLDLPAESGDLDRFAVVLDTMQSQNPSTGRYSGGRVAISGVIWAKRDSGTSGPLAIPSIGSRELTLGAEGGAQVIAESGDWALIRFPFGGGGGGGTFTQVILSGIVATGWANGGV